MIINNVTIIGQMIKDYDILPKRILHCILYIYQGELSAKKYVPKLYL
jgi:hypothetical protein